VSAPSPDPPPGSPRYGINRAVVDLCRQPNARALVATKAEFFAGYALSDEERQALATHDYVKLFELGAHPFLTLTLCIALFERDYDEPLAFQREYAVRLQHWQLPYPDIAT